MDKINTKHLMFMIWGTSIVAMKTYPNVFIRHGGRDSWISVIIASILLLLYFIYLLFICKKRNCFDMAEIYHRALGKTMGDIFLVLFLITLILSLVESASVQANALHVNMLADTPPWFFLIFMVLPAIYITEKGTRAINIVTIIGICLIMLAGINLGILTYKYKKMSYLLPILADGITPNFLLSIAKALGCYSGIAICLPFLSRVRNKSKITMHSIIAILIVVQMEVVANFGVLTTFGTVRVLKINYPKLIQTQLVSYFGFLEGGEFFVMLQMVGGWFIKYVIALAAALILMRKLSLFNKYWIYVIGLFVFVASYVICAKVMTVYKFLDFYVYLSLVNFIISPVIIFTIFYFRTKKH